MSYQVLARRWRPLTFDAVVGQAPVVRTLKNALTQERIAHAYLFAGPRGVGKTTTALDVLEIDGASNRGIDEVRTLRENARYAPARGRRKVYIIDEVHMLTEPAFNALLKTLEEPPAHVVFVLATTEARRLPATILSRCQRFDFRPIAGAEIGEALRRILEEEKVPADAVEPDALRLLARAADGSLRDALSLLDTALAYGEGRVGARTVEELLGSGGAEAAWALAGALVRREAADALQRIADAAASGLDLALLSEETMEVLRRALLVAVTGTPGPDATQDETARLTALGSDEGAGEPDLLLLLRGLLDADTEMRKSPHPRVDLEIAVVRLCHRPRPALIETVLERLEQAEARLRGYGGAAEPAAPVQSDLLGGPPASAPSRPVAVPRPVERVPAPAPPPPGREAPPVARPPAMTAVVPRSGAETWAAVVAEIIRVRPTLGHLLSEGVVVESDESRLTVAVANGSAFVTEQLKKAENRELVLAAARRLQPGLREVAFTTGIPPGGVPAGTHPVVQAAMELFEGEITQVRAAPGPRAGAPATPAGEAP